VSALAGVLTLACPQGYVRVFADEGPPMAALMARLIAAQRSGQTAAGVPLGCLARQTASAGLTWMCTRCLCWTERRRQICSRGGGREDPQCRQS